MVLPMPRIPLKRKRYLLLIVALFFAGSTSLGYYRYSRPVASPSVQTTFKIDDESDEPVDIAWPTTSQASIGTVEHGLLASKPNQTPLPAASTAKVIAALTILKEKPLALGEQGPLITFTEKDIEIYNKYIALNGSLVAVQLGQQLSQYQILQGILIRSGNNLADSLAIWAFGSLSEYQLAAQQLVDELGMKNTTVGIDASGYSPTTTTTAEDLTILGIAAMKHGVIRDIVRQPASNLPIDGVKPSTNWMLGQNGTVGIKTGSLPSVGGVFMIASEYHPEGEEPITVVGAVQGEPTTYAAILESGKLAEATKSLFLSKPVIKSGETVGTISTAWGEQTSIVAAEDITIFGWKYATIEPTIAISNTIPIQEGAVVGSLSVNDKEVNLIAVNAVLGPSWQWRLMTKR